MFAQDIMHAVVMPLFEGDIYAAVPDFLGAALFKDGRHRLRHIIAFHYSRIGNHSHVSSKFHEQCNKADPLRSGQALQHGQSKLPTRAARFLARKIFTPFILGFQILTIGGYEEFWPTGYNAV